MTTLKHLHHLADTIGPRGSTTPQEVEAAGYATNVLKKAELSPTTEIFKSARSSYYPFVLFTGLVLFSVVLFWIGGRSGAILALIITILATASILLEMTFRPNLLRWVLPKGQSQNVSATIQPTGQPHQRVVLLGHLDTHRTPLIFSSDGWIKLLGKLTPITLACTLALVILFAIGIGSPAMIWRLWSIPFALFVLALFLLTAQADFSSYTAGANDNATGAAVVLNLAERLHDEPMMHTAIHIVLTGCEEVGCYGADAFAQAHRDQLKDAIWLPIDSIGGIGASVAYLTSERFLLTSRSDPALLVLADQIAKQHPELDAMPHQFQSTYTEGAIGAKHGLRILPILGLRRDGVHPEWHRPTDIIKNVDTAVVERAETFIWKLLHAIDTQVT